MTLEQITALTLEDVFEIILQRLVDFSGVPEGEPLYIIAEEEGPKYGRLALHEPLEKPTLEAMESDLITYKAELTATEEARLAEVARIENLKARWSTFANRDPNAAYSELNPDPGNPNYAVYFRDKILGEEDKDLAESRLAALEAKDATIAAKLTEDTDIAAAYTTMSGTISAAAKALFGTPDEATQLAFAMKWRLRADRPADYVGEPLYVFKIVEGFPTLKAPLNTQEKIGNYFNALVDKLIVFDKLQDAAINTYLQAKAGIEA